MIAKNIQIMNMRSTFFFIRNKVWWMISGVWLMLSAIVSLFKEQGEFLALDLGGSNFRVLLVKVNADGEQEVEMENQIYTIPDDVMRGSGSEVSFLVIKRILHAHHCPDP